MSINFWVSSLSVKALVVFFCLFSACSDDDEGFQEATPSITKPSVSAVSVSTVDTALAFEAEVAADGGGQILRRGFIWHTHDDYDIQFNTGSSFNGEGMGSFRTVTGDFEVGVEYHVKAYAENQMGVAYGPSRTVTRNR